MQEAAKTFFAPQLMIKSGVMQLDFYKQALGAEELRRFDNPDGSIHVSEMTIGGNLFHFHEENAGKGHLDPTRAGGVTTIIDLFVPDVDAVLARVQASGITLLSPAQDYEYGYRQGSFVDPHGHEWLISQVI